MSPPAAASLSSDDLLACASPEGLTALFARLGYPAELLGADYLFPEGAEGLRAAQPAFSYTLKRFVDHTWMVQVNDLRSMPLLVPEPEESSALAGMADNLIATLGSLTDQAMEQNLLAAGNRLLRASALEPFDEF